MRSSRFSTRSPQSRGSSTSSPAPMSMSEAILPEKWGYGYFDWSYVKDVHRRFGSARLSTYPHFSLLELFYYVFVRRIRMVSILNFIDYNKQQAMEVLQNQLGWVYYGGKHYESIYTRFYQAYLLPTKFDIDKRKAHYSNLILSGQMTPGGSAGSDEGAGLPRGSSGGGPSIRASRSSSSTNAAFAEIMARRARRFWTTRTTAMCLLLPRSW